MSGARRISNIVRLPLFARHRITCMVHARSCHRLRAVPTDRLEIIRDVGPRDRICVCIAERFGLDLPDRELRERLCADPVASVTTN